MQSRQATTSAAHRRVRERLARLATTRANARAGLVADCAVSAGLFAAGLSRHDATLRGALLAIVAGLLLFSFIEYAFHRWLFHGGRGVAESGHRKHHAEPQGDDALPFFLPPLGMLALAAALTIALPVPAALLFAAALAAGYAAYGLAHTAIHAVRFRTPVLMRWAARHHIHHHHPQRNFGVTTPLWDVLLGTRYSPVRVATRGGA